MVKCVIEITDFEDLPEILALRWWEAAYESLEAIEKRNLKIEFMEYLEGLSAYPLSSDITNLLLHDMNDFYKAVGLYAEADLKNQNHLEMYSLYENLVDYNETYYEQDDLKDIFTGMTWPEIQNMVEEFLDEYPKCKEYITLDNVNKSLRLNRDLINLFY